MCVLLLVLDAACGKVRVGWVACWVRFDAVEMAFGNFEGFEAVSLLKDTVCKGAGGVVRGGGLSGERGVT